MKKIISLLSAIAVGLSGMGISVLAAENSAVTADKTAQWKANAADGTYDLRIHGWSTWETAAYIGFTLPDSFDPEALESAELIVNTNAANASSTAYIYAADYAGFDNNAQYQGSENVPAYTESEFASFTSPAAAGEFSIDVTDYLCTLSAGAGNAAFRIDVKSQDSNNDWRIDSCNNGGKSPELKLNYGGGSGIVNPRFSNGETGWTISNPDNMTVSDGVLTASGTDYEARVSQTVTGLENGVYDLTAYTTSTDISGSCYLYAKTAGHTMASTAVPISASAQKIVVPGVIVEDGNCDVGLYVNGSTTLTLDNFSLSKSEETRVPFLKGGEISKLTYIEDMGGKFYYADGTEGDALQIMAENGFNLARIRILNDPGKGHGDGDYYLPEGYQDEADCLALARRAKDKGMQIEWTFAYSDYWVDGEKQMVPHEWQEYITANNLTGEALAKYLEEQVYAYTKDIMQKLIAQGTCPEYVSIGNEIQVGILFNKYTNNNGFYNKSAYLARFLSAGARAVRETAPETKIILHSDNGGKVYGRGTFVATMRLIKDDFDVIGVSYYPFYNKDVSINTVVNEFATLINEFDKDVIIMETGYNWNPLKADGWPGQLQDSGYYTDIYGETQEGQRAFLTELYAKLKQVAGGRCIGDLYWDPVMIHSPEWKIGWAVRESDDCTDSNVVPNSTIFDFDGKEVAGQQAMKYNTNSTDKVNISGKISCADGIAADTRVSFTVNGADYTVTTDKFGEYIAAVPYPSSGTFEISAQGSSKKYTFDAPYDGVLLKNVDFEITEKQPDRITKLEGQFDETGGLRYDADYVTETENPAFYTAVYKDGILQGCKTEKSGVFAVDGSGTYTLKAFLWNNMNPICEAESKDIICSE